MDIVRFGLLGCGRIAKMHLSSIASIEGSELAAICDIDKKKRTVAKKLNVPFYTDYKKMLKRNDIDIISICTPNGMHFKMARDTILSGKHVLLEKPITLNLRDNDNLINLAKDHEKHFFAVKQVRFNPAIQALKQAIKENKFKKIHSAALVVRWQRPQKYFDESNWRGSKKLDGGTLVNQGIHYIDILQWILGPVKSVFGKKATLAHNIEIEDFATAIITFKNRCYATVEFSVNTYPKNLECSITVLGEKGSVKLSGSAMNKIEFWHVEDCPKPDIENGLSPNIYANGMYQGSCPNHIFVYQEILNVLKGDNITYTDGHDARKSLELVQAIYTSSELGKEIHFL